MSKLHSSKPTPEDIPAARRQPTEVSLDEIEQAGMRSQPKKEGRSRLFVLLAVAAILAVAASIWQRKTLLPGAQAFYRNVSTGIGKASQKINTKITGKPFPQTQPAESASPTPPYQVAAPTGENKEKILIIGPYPNDDTPEGNSEKNPSKNVPQQTASEPDTLLNHRRYDEAKQTELVPLDPSSELKLQPVAQASVSAMLEKARIEGVKLSVISAFRTVEDQDFLYFKIKAERGQTAKTRAAVSAPPGYSEHHTGYAVDFIDASQPDTQLSQSFETTAAFKWLVKNAGYFNFEMSFPKNGDSAVSYEPWHWRYVGDQKSLELFYKDQPKKQTQDSTQK